jgi:transposase-like protein
MIDEAARFTAEHSLMDSNIKIRELESKIEKLEEENAKLKKLTLDIGKKNIK